MSENEKRFTPKDIEKILFLIYMDMRAGRLYEDKACKEVFVLYSMLKAIDLDIKIKKQTS